MYNIFKKTENNEQWNKKKPKSQHIKPFLNFETKVLSCQKTFCLYKMPILFFLLI